MNRLLPPILETDRLVLRPFAFDDAPRVQSLAGDRRVAEMTSLIPHPYPDGSAQAWIAMQQVEWTLGRSVTYAVTLRGNGRLIGSVSLRLFAQGPRAELGFWIGVPYWNHGYCTEAARELVRYGFEELDLQWIHARHFTHNAASGRVMQKLGMSCEGIARNAGCRRGRLLDLVDYVLPAGNVRIRYPAA